MGAYTTLDIKRQDAIDFILRNAENLTNDELEEVVFEMLKLRTLHNYKIVPDADNDCEDLMEFDQYYT